MRQTPAPGQRKSAAGIFTRLMLVILTAELAEMWLFSGVFDRLGPFTAALADGALLVLMIAPPIWLLVIRPLDDARTTGAPPPRFAPAGLFIRILAVVAATDFLVMLFLPFLPQVDAQTHYFADTCFTLFLSAPLLWWILSREKLSSIDSLSDPLLNPVQLYVMLLGLVLTIDVVDMPLVMLLSSGKTEFIKKIIDALLATLFVSPILWLLVIRPLRRVALVEKTRSDTVQAQVVDAIVAIDEQGVIENMNPAAERIFGYSAAEIAGAPAQCLFAETGQSLDDMVRIASTNERGKADSARHEAFGRRKDGSTFTIDLSFSLVQLEGRRQFLIIMRDISGRKEMEQALRESEASFRSLSESLQRSLSLLTATLESTVDGILVVDATRRIQTFNQKFLDMWRIPRHVAENSDSHQLLACIWEQLEDPEAFMARVHELYGKPEATALDLIRLKDGRVIERYSQPQMMGKERIGRVWSFRDITARMKAEEALKESEERYNIAVNGADEGIWDWNILTGEVFYTPRLKSLLGFTDEDLEKVYSGTFEALLHPDDHDRVVEAVRNHLNERIPYDIEGRLRTGPGEYRWFRARGQALWDESGKAVRMAGSIGDITERKEAEKALLESETRFRQIFEQSEDAIIFFKPNACAIIDVNETAENLYGYTKAELRGGGLERLCKPKDFATLSRVICDMSHEGISSLDRIVNLRKDGSEFIVSVRGKVIILLGVPIIFCTIRDISERVRMEDESRDIQAKLIQANKMTSLGLLVAGVAHEINNPNNFIMANSQLLERVWQDALKVLREYYRENGDFQVGGIPFSVMNEDSSRLFTGILDGSRRINEIVSNLKGFARQDRNITEHGVDVNRVVTVAVTILHHQLIKHTDNFHLDLTEDIPRVDGSSQQLEQVVINLLMNACQALPHKQRGIWVTTGYDPGAEQVTITVRDEGLGMPGQVSSRMLEPFFTTRLDRGGTGLGLFISQSIVKEHDGTLEFTSEPGKGTTFIVKIPAGKPASQELST